MHEGSSQALSLQLGSLNAVPAAFERAASGNNQRAPVGYFVGHSLNHETRSFVGPYACSVHAACCCSGTYLRCYSADTLSKLSGVVRASSAVNGAPGTPPWATSHCRSEPIVDAAGSCCARHMVCTALRIQVPIHSFTLTRHPLPR
jgi:hypothetical protein